MAISNYYFLNITVALIVSIVVQAAPLESDTNIFVQDGTVFIGCLLLTVFITFKVVGIVQCGSLKCPEGTDSCDIHESSSTEDPTKIETLVQCRNNGNGIINNQ